MMNKKGDLRPQVSSAGSKVYEGTVRLINCVTTRFFCRQLLANAAIAPSLFITQRAVEKHINSIFAKLGVGVQDQAHPRVRAVLMYLSDGGRRLHHRGASSPSPEDHPISRRKSASGTP